MDDLREKKVRVALFIVDACRDNPFRDGSGRSVGGTRGLARVEPAEGSFVMYSAGAGEQALDRLPGADASPNSVYTRTLLPILATPGLSLQEIAIARARGGGGGGARRGPQADARLLRPARGQVRAQGRRWPRMPSRPGPPPAAERGRRGALGRGEGQSSIADAGGVLSASTRARRHGECVAARIEELKKQQASP